MCNRCYNDTHGDMATKVMHNLSQAIALNSTLDGAQVEFCRARHRQEQQGMGYCTSLRCSPFKGNSHSFFKPRMQFFKCNVCSYLRLGFSSSGKNSVWMWPVGARITPTAHVHVSFMFIKGSQVFTVYSIVLEMLALKSSPLLILLFLLSFLSSEPDFSDTGQ